MSPATGAIDIDPKARLLQVAWAVTLALAVATDVTAAPAPSALQWALFAALLCSAAIPFFWKAAWSLRSYAGILLLLTLLAVFFWTPLPAWMSNQVWFPDPAGYRAAVIMQTPKVVAAFIMIAVLLLLGYQPLEFFLPVETRSTFWIASGVGAALILGAVAFSPSTAPPARGAGFLQLLPLALVPAAMNSFAEEMLYRGVLLAPLLRRVPPRQAIWMTAALFGIAHYYGTPSGLPGMALTFIAGWIFGAAMVQTRSILLPWLLHFASDAVIFVGSALQN